MPSLLAHDAPAADALAAPIHLLNCGESASGKTGALASLLTAGYRLRILDFDGKVDILRSYIPRDAPCDAVMYARCFDRPRNDKGVPKYSSLTAFATATAAINTDTASDPASPWPGENPDEWGLDTVLVLDTLNTFSAAVERKAQALGGRLNQKMQTDDYGSLGSMGMSFIQMMLGMNCHIIVNSHIKYIGENEAKGLPARVRPAAKGNMISDDIGTYFPNQIVTKLVGRGTNARRVLSTVSDGTVPVATANPRAVQAEYPIETGMAQLFADLRKGSAA